MIGLRELQSAFLELSKGLVSFDFSNLRFLDRFFNLPIKAINSSDNIGLIKDNDNLYQWILTKDKWNQFFNILADIRNDENNLHHYLDSDSVDNLDLQVVLSLNEYDDDLWTKK